MFVLILFMSLNMCTIFTYINIHIIIKKSFSWCYKKNLRNNEKLSRRGFFVYANKEIQNYYQLTRSNKKMYEHARAMQR